MGLHGDREVLPQVLTEMLREAGVQIYFRTAVVDAVMEGNTIKGVIIQNKTGREAISAKVVIDCTGSADVALHAGVPCADIPDRRSGGMTFGLSGVNFEKVRDYATEKGIIAYLGYASKGGTGKDNITRVGFKLGELEEFKPYVKDYCFHIEPCIVSNRENQATQVNGVSLSFDTSDPRELTKAAIKLTDCCFVMAKTLKEKFPGFENSYLDWVSPAVGIRFVRQVICDYDITQDDINRNLIPQDAIGLYGTQDAHFMGYDIKGGYYGLPYRALVPQKAENLLVAGKMISSDWVVWMSTRLTGSCFLQGQAAGTAAAIAVKKQTTVRNIDTGELRAALKKDGVYLG
jgi:hypothetical protein